MPQQRLCQAVEAMAASAEPIQRRLFWAGQYLSPLCRDDFDPNDRDEFVAIMDALTTREPVGDEGSLQATTAALSNNEAVEIARRIVELDGVYRPLE
jgi:hypothetical protein